MLRRRAFRLIRTFEGESFALDAAACMVDIAVSTAVGIAVDIGVDIVADIEVAVAGAGAGASLVAVLPFVDKAEPFACKVRLDRVF
ncbi:hypothetical protein bcgnr5386_28350 [Bacillus cereus]